MIPIVNFISYFYRDPLFNYKPKASQVIFIIVENVSLEIFSNISIKNEQIARIYNNLLKKGDITEYVGDYDDNVHKKSINNSKKLKLHKSGISGGENLLENVHTWMPATTSLLNTVMEVVSPAPGNSSIQEELLCITPNTRCNLFGEEGRSSYLTCNYILEFIRFAILFRCRLNVIIFKTSF